LSDRSMCGNLIDRRYWRGMYLAVRNRINGKPIEREVGQQSNGKVSNPPDEVIGMSCEMAGMHRHHEILEPGQYVARHAAPQRPSADGAAERGGAQFDKRDG
jgi:hypothetical protein